MSVWHRTLGVGQPSLLGEFGVDALERVEQGRRDPQRLSVFDQSPRIFRKAVSAVTAVATIKNIEMAIADAGVDTDRRAHEVVIRASRLADVVDLIRENHPRG